MKIDFKATHELNQVIGFVNDKGETVRTYPLTELENFVIERGLNDYYKSEHVSGSGMPCDPNNVEREVTGYVPVNEWLDEQSNFEHACELFYKHKNPHEFKSFNREQETIRRVG